MATPCPMGYIPDSSTGLCKPSGSSVPSGFGNMGGSSPLSGSSYASALSNPLPDPTAKATSSATISRTSGEVGVASAPTTGPDTGGGAPPLPTWSNTPNPPGGTYIFPGSIPGTCPKGATAEPGSGACFCGDGECRDVVSGECRKYNSNNEKVNETDDITRPTGGGRGFCRQLDPGTAGQGAGAGGGGGTGAIPGGGDVWAQIEALLKSPSRYTPEVMAQLTGLAKNNEESQIKAATDAAASDQVRRGIYSSPLAAALTQKAGQPAAQAYDKSIGDLNIAKVNADAQDKMFAVQAAMQWVQMQMQQKQFDSNLKLAYARLLQEWQMLQAQLNDPYRLLAGVV